MVKAPAHFKKVIEVADGLAYEASLVAYGVLPQLGRIADLSPGGGFVVAPVHHIRAQYSRKLAFLLRTADPDWHL